MADSPQSPFFTLLPQELRDMIYSFAYSDPYPKRFKLVHPRRKRERTIIIPVEVFLVGWDETFKSPGPKPEPEPLPECRLQGMMVCRQWHREATEEWFRKRTIAVEIISDLGALCGTPATTLQRNILSLQVQVPAEESFAILAKLPKLRRVSLHVCNAFFPLNKMDPYKNVFQPSDFERMPMLCDLVHSLALTKINLVGFGPIHDVERMEDAIWNSNITALADRLCQQRKILMRKLSKEKQRRERRGKCREIRRRKQLTLLAMAVGVATGVWAAIRGKD